MSELKQMGTNVQIGMSGLLTLREVVESRPEIVKLMESALIQKVIVVASNRGAAKVRVTYIPKEVKAGKDDGDGKGK